ncbi:MAG TPA: hypothetical protein DEG43_15915, partial [Acidimicrobiaceae bacterium]|nr:hypothetical protein [Acidimicrobiaceae bacterium]
VPGRVPLYGRQRLLVQRADDGRARRYEREVRSVDPHSIRLALRHDDSLVLVSLSTRNDSKVSVVAGAAQDQALVILLVAESRVDEYLGVGYLTSSLRDAGFDVEVFQLAFPGHADELARRLGSSRRVVLVGIAWLYDSSAPLVADAARLVKQVRADVPVVVGGHPPSLSPGQALALAADIDYVLRGEGDHNIVVLAGILDTLQGSVESVPGIAVRKGDSVLLGEAPAQIADLEALGLAARDTLQHVLSQAASPAAVVARLCGSRGCYARCEFCSMVSFYNLDGAGMKWRHRSAKAIVDEIEQLVESYQVSRFWFVDDEFLGTPKEHGERALAVAQRIIERRLDIEWGFDARANGVAGLPPGGPELLRSSGVRVVAMGLESGSQAALKRLNKGIRVESNRLAVERLRASGIEHRFGFIMFDPGTTMEDLRLNVDFVRFAEPHRICNTGPFRLLNAEYPEVGTPLAIRLGVGATTSEALVEQNKPRLSEDGLGYAFDDDRVGRTRRLLFDFAQTVVEGVMTPRPVGEPSLLSEVWWGGTNHLPENVAAMNAFLDVFDWVLSDLNPSEARELPIEAHDLFANQFRAYLCAESADFLRME